MHRIISLSIVTFFIGFAFAQTPTEFYNYIHYSSESGLPHSLVFDCAQSNDGFIWVATNNGLARFDGYNFKTFRPQKNKAQNISGKSVTRLFFDNNNNLWMTIQGIGLNRLALATDRFSKYYPNNLDSNAVSGNDANCFFLDKDSTLWIGTNRGLDYFDAKESRFVNVLKRETNKAHNVIAIAEDNYNRIWFISNMRIGFFDKLTQTISQLSDLEQQAWAQSAQVNMMLMDKEQNLWVATKNKGLFCYDLVKNKIKYQLSNFANIDKLHLNKQGDLFFIALHSQSHLFYIPKAAIPELTYHSIYHFSDNTLTLNVNYVDDFDGNVWVSSGDGMLKIYPDFSLVKIRSKNNDQTDLLSSNIHADLMDNMGNLWLRSERKGLVMIDLNQKQFTQYKHLKNENHVIGGDNISMVYEDSQKNIWVGTYGEGISCYNPKTKKHRTIPYNGTDLTKIIYRAPAGIVEDADGFIWIGFYDGGLLKVHPKTMTVEYFTDANPKAKNYFKGNIIRSMIKAKDNNIWITTNNYGIVEYKTATKQFIYHSEKHEPNYYANSHYRVIFQTKDGIFWTGTQNGGLGKYNSQTNEFTHYTSKTDGSNSISGNTVYFVHEQSDSILWIGTDKGLNKFNRSTNTFTEYQQENQGFICAVYRIYPDNMGNFWLSGDCGIIKFDPNTGNYVKFLKADDLPATEFNTTAGCLTSEGEIFFGSSNGLVSFFPESIKPNPYNSKPKVTNLKIFNQSVLPGDSLNKKVILNENINNVDKIVLPHNLNDFTLEFSAMHFSAPSKNQYFYLLEGFNDRWISTDASRRWANYTGLRPGHYNFYLKSTNSDGVLCDSNKMVRIEIEILPSFFETNLFKAGTLIVLFLMIFAFFRMRLRAMKRHRKELEETVVARTEELHKKNSMLEERQEEISLQNEELEKHRNHLEELVEIRTEELKKAKLKAEEADRLKSSFLANMSHEIRTPMNAIIGFSSLLHDDLAKPEEKQMYVALILSNGETLLNLLNDIIDISLLESEQLKIHKDETNISKLVYEIFVAFNNCVQIRERPKLAIILENNDIKPLIVKTDYTRLLQILNNIIGNAIKYTTEGTIKISYKQKNQMVEFAIADTGIGITEDAIQAVFDRFHKIENKETSFYRGGGLGLSISKSLVELLGGSIWVESKPGKGSTFYFTIATK